MALDPDLWNDDGTPKRPDPAAYGDSEKYAQTPFADLAADEAGVFIAFQAGNKTAAVGDVVHFWDGETCRASIVMETEGHTATLRVHIPHQPFEDWEADHDETRENAGTWHFTWGQCS